LSSVSVKALTLTSASITDASATAFGILVEFIIHVGTIYKGNIIRTHALGTITSNTTHTNAPVVVTHTNIVECALAMSTAAVRTVCGDFGDNK
jgi:hypothetical protein